MASVYLFLATHFLSNYSEVIDYIKGIPHAFGLLAIFFVYIFLYNISLKTIHGIKFFIITNHYIIIIFTFFNFVICLFTDNIIQEIDINNTKPIFGQLYFFYILNVIYILIVNIIIVISSMVFSVKKSFYTYIILGLLLSVTWAVITNLFIPVLFRTSSYSLLGPLGITFFLFSVYQAYVKTKLLSPSTILKKILIYSIISIFSYTVFYLVAYMETVFFGSIFSREAYLFGILVAPTFVIFYELINRSIYRFPLIFPKDVTTKNYVDEFAITIKLSQNFDRIETNLDNILSILINTNEYSIIITGQYSFNSLNTSRIKFDPNWDKKLIFFKAKKEIMNQLYVVKDIVQLGIKYNTDSLAYLIDHMNKNNYVIFGIFGDEYVKICIFLGSKDRFDINIEILDLLSKVMHNTAETISKIVLNEIFRKRLLLLKNSISIFIEKEKEQIKIVQEKYQREKDMLGIIGHELKTPLTVARGNMEFLYDKVMNANSIIELDLDYLKKKIDKIFKSISKEIDLVQTLLSSGHVENDKISFQFSLFNFLDVVDYSYELFSDDGIRKGLCVNYEKPTDYENYIVFSDQSRLLEITNNLISNAIKYTDKGGVDILISQDGERIIFKVKDTGRGIPRHLLHKIGQKYFRIDQYGKGSNDANVVRSGGTGLGIYVIKNILDAMGGKLNIVSEYGVGSTFTAYIPKDVPNYIASRINDLGFMTTNPLAVKIFQEIKVYSGKGSNITQTTQSPQI